MRLLAYLLTALLIATPADSPRAQNVSNACIDDSQVLSTPGMQRLFSSIVQTRLALPADTALNEAPVALLTVGTGGNVLSAEIYRSTSIPELDQLVIAWSKGIQVTPSLCHTQQRQIYVPIDISCPANPPRDLGLPSIDPLQRTFERHGSTSDIGLDIEVLWDRSGHVQAAKLRNPTSNNSINSAAIQWAKQITVKPGTAGGLRIPIQLHIR